MGDNPCFKQGSPAMAVSVISSCFKYYVYKWKEEAVTDLIWIFNYGRE